MITESPPEQVTTASPPARVGRGVPSSLAVSKQLVRVVAPGATRLRDKAGEDPVVAGNGSGVRATRDRTGRATPRLEHGDANVALGTLREGVGPTWRRRRRPRGRARPNERRR